MNKKILLILGVLAILMANPFHAAAQSSKAELQSQKYAGIEVADNSVSVPFGDLGYREKALVSPFDVTNIFFSTPPSWKLIPGGTIDLQFDVILTGADVDKIVGFKNPYGGSLLLTLNKQIIGSISLDEIGSHVVRLEIPASALASTREDGRHQLTIALDAQFSCDYDIRASVIIKSTSFLELLFETLSPELNLSRLPSPFYLANSFIPDTTLIVIPDDPSVLEIQAALDVMAGFGSMIGGSYSMDLINVSQFSLVDPALSHVIFVGMPDQLPILSNVDFQVPVANGQFVKLPPESDGDGIVQLALSPWNPNKVIMMVSGNSGEAVVKAGQAVSSGSIFVYQNPALAFVSNVQLLSESLPVVEDFSFENMGYVTETLSGVGVRSQEYLFYVSKEQVATNEGYIDLVYNHSGLLNYGVPSFSVDLNRQVFASATFSKESEQVTTLHIKIPPGFLRFGENRLKVTASMLIFSSCDTSGFSDPWFAISDQSSIYLPIATGDDLSEPLLKDLKFFPDLFVAHSDLGDVAFVLQKSDNVSLKIAGNLAYNLGGIANPLIVNLRVAYADDVPQDIRDTKSMIILGLASESPLLAEFNEMLPAPFDFTNNTASERQMQVVYRIPSGVSVGYLELMSSPFNAEKSILVVAGNTPDGLIFAGNGLLIAELQTQLAGVFAVMNGTQIATGNASSPFSVVGDVIPGSVPVNTTPVPSLLGGVPPTERPVWLLPVIVILLLSILGILGYVAVAAIAKRRSQRIEVPNDGENVDKSNEGQK